LRLQPQYRDANNTGEINGVASGLIVQVWNNQSLSGIVTAMQIDQLMRGAIAEIINTNTRIEQANVSGNAVILKASADVGNITDVRVDLPANIGDINTNDLMNIACAEPQDIVYYSSDGVQIDPANNAKTVAYVIIKQRQDVDVETSGRVDAEAGGKNVSGSTGDLYLGTIKGNETRIKSGTGIYNAGGGTISCADLLLEASGATIGTIEAPVAINMISTSG
jgi:hypothetical protein